MKAALGSRGAKEVDPWEGMTKPEDVRKGERPSEYAMRKAEPEFEAAKQEKKGPEAGGSPEKAPEPGSDSGVRVLVKSWYTGDRAPMSTLLRDSAGLQHVKGGDWTSDLLEESKAMDIIDWLLELRHPDHPRKKAIEDGLIEIRAVNEAGEIQYEKGELRKKTL
jgi:hypothetical protein